jgi:hypothetical protein
MMTRRVLLIALLVLVSTVTLWAQATKIQSSGTLPTNCTVGNVYLKTGSSAGFYICLATDTWTGPLLTPPGGGGGGGTGNSTSTGAVGSEPASPASGDLYFQNNGFAISRYSGSAWTPWGPNFMFTAPISGDFSWVNQGSASVDTTNGGVYLEAPAAAGENVRARVKTAPATPYTITLGFIPGAIPPPTSVSNMGLTFRETGTGELATCALGFTGGGVYQLFSYKFTSPTVFSATYINTAYMMTPIVWLRMTDDGSNRKCAFSGDGQHFIEYHSVARTDFLTADQVGYYVNAAQNTRAVGMTVLSWKQE